MPFGFTTCTIQVRAVPPTFTVAWIWLADANWMTAPCSVSEAPAVVSTTCSPLPGWKPEPLMVSVCAAAERVMGFGLSEVMAGGATTWKLPLLEASPLGLTTCTVQVRAVAPTSISARICVLLTKAICPPLKVVVGPPAYPTIAFNPVPLTKPLPLMVMTWLALAPVSGLGVTLPTTGGAAGATRLAALDAGPVGLATVMLQAPAAAPVMTVAWIWVALRLVTGRLLLPPE